MVENKQSFGVPYIYREREEIKTYSLANMLISFGKRKDISDSGSRNTGRKTIFKENNRLKRCSL